MNKKDLEQKLDKLIENVDDMICDHVANKMINDETEKQDKLKEMKDATMEFNRVNYMSFYFDSMSIIKKYFPYLWKEFEHFYERSLPPEFCDNYNKLTSFNTGIRHYLTSHWAPSNETSKVIWNGNVKNTLIMQKGILIHAKNSINDLSDINIDGQVVYEDSKEAINFLIKNKFFRSSSMIASVLMEGLIKKIAKDNGYVVTTKQDKSLENHLVFLKNHGIINDSEKKRIDSYISIRNEVVAHKNGLEDTVSKENAQDMLAGLLYIEAVFKMS